MANGGSVEHHSSTGRESEDRTLNITLTSERMSSSINHHQIFSHDVKVKKEVRSVLGWPSNTFSIDSYRTSSTGMKGNCANDCSNDVLQPLEYPHTVLVFVPGNPGLVEWYISSFMEIVQRLGPGYAARAVSNAGHAVTADLTHPHKYDDEKDDDDAKSDCRGQDVEERSMRISWTIDGQVLHKCAYMDMLAEDFRQQLLSTTANARGCDEFSSGALQQQLPQYVLISHSIGAHFTQRLCVLRPDLLQRMQLLIHLTPFIQMKAPWPKQALLNILASRPHTTIAVHKRLMKFLRWCPKMFVAAMVDSTMKQADADTRQITTQLLRQPAFAKNFFALGLEEIRDVPKAIDVS